MIGSASEPRTRCVAATGRTAFATGACFGDRFHVADAADLLQREPHFRAPANPREFCGPGSRLRIPAPSPTGGRRDETEKAFPQSSRPLHEQRDLLEWWGTATRADRPRPSRCPRRPGDSKRCAENRGRSAPAGAVQTWKQRFSFAANGSDFGSGSSKGVLAHPAVPDDEEPSHGRRPSPSMRPRARVLILAPRVCRKSGGYPDRSQHSPPFRIQVCVSVVRKITIAGGCAMPVWIPIRIRLGRVR